MVKITANDVGRKVVLRNGNINTIRGFKPINIWPVELDSGTTRRMDGREVSARKESDYDIIAFADEPTQDAVQAIAKAEDGKTLRDEFAMAALTGLLAHYGIRGIENLVEATTAVVDEIMKARQQPMKDNGDAKR